MFKFDLDQGKKIILGVGIIVLVSVGAVVFLYMPHLSRHQVLTQQTKKMEADINRAKHFIRKQTQAMRPRRLIRQDQIVLAINAITQAGQLNEINFLSINPQDIEKLSDTPFSRLPIKIKATSEYKNLALFLNQLNQLEDGIILIRSFDIKREENILPLVQSTLILDVYLKDG